jgi:cellulose synthase/poly-beta-1,6-N-acetylglucosamine synthase-like glycosyltransferase
MSAQYENYVEPIVIDSSTKEPIDKVALIGLLKAHGVKTGLVEDSEVGLEDVIPALLKSKINPPEEFYNELAEKLGMDFFSSQKIKQTYSQTQKSKLITILPYPIISKYKVIPIEIRGSTVDLAVDNPLDRKVQVAVQYLFLGYQINIKVASSATIDLAIDNIYREIHKKNAMLDLFNRTPEQSAYRVLYPNQKYFLVGLTAAITVAVILNSVLTFMAMFAFISISYFIVNPIKIYISLRGFKGARAPTRITQGEMLWAPDEDFPIYTVLIPVFREASILAQNLRNMYRLNYPKNKLDIKILMEESDEETINEAKALGLFGAPTKKVEGIPEEEYSDFLKNFDPIIIPRGKVTTKPRACNYGLLRAKGELCVIYDAEDNPDPDQLRKAAIVFMRSTEDVICLQSKLNFYNSDENTITKWFSIEYANWYEFYLQGLDWIDAPIPLGGTSNHFRKKGLDELGRWDPYNVTEDADIGIRLARQKLKTEVIDTTTLEEATVTPKAWVVQRSRWYKGHIQTFLVHMRSPRKLFKDLGAKKFVKFQLTFSTGAFIPLINPMLWVILAASLIMPIWFSWLIPSYLMPLCIFNLAIGNLSYITTYAVACIKLKKYSYIPYALAMPLYWVLISFAAWRGFIQLFTKPFHWDKTQHGVSKVVNPSKKP